MRYRIQTPVHRFDGVVAGVQFRNGTAVIDDATQGPALAYFRRRHYGVAPEVEGEHGPELVGDADHPTEAPDTDDAGEPGAADAPQEAPEGEAKKPAGSRTKKTTTGSTK